MLHTVCREIHCSVLHSQAKESVIFKDYVNLTLLPLICSPFSLLSIQISCRIAPLEVCIRKWRSITFQVHFGTKFNLTQNPFYEYCVVQVYIIIRMLFKAKNFEDHSNNMFCVPVCPLTRIQRFCPSDVDITRPFFIWIPFAFNSIKFCKIFTSCRQAIMPFTDYCTTCNFHLSQGLSNTFNYRQQEVTNFKGQLDSK